MAKSDSLCAATDMKHFQNFVAFLAITGLALAMTLVWFLIYLQGFQP